MQLNDNLQNIKEWASQWLVNFSAPKTKLMTCSFRKASDDAPVSFDGNVLSDVNSHKHLGITISSRLSWSDHITKLVESVTPTIDVLKRLKYDLDRKSIETIYFIFIRSKL